MGILQNPVIIAAVAYFLIVNLFCFCLCAYDKHISKKDGKRRIPERRFFILSALGASPFMLLGMYVFHHKTKHKSFTYGIPFILIIQVLIIVLVYINIAN